MLFSLSCSSVESTQDFRLSIRKMDAYTRFNRCLFEWERALLRLLGHDFMGEKFERNFMTFFLYTLLLSAVAGMIYTFVFYDSLERIFSVLFFLIALQVKAGNRLFFLLS